MTTAQAWIKKLNLKPHPEGGHYREVYRASSRICSEKGLPRVCSTAIYYLLQSDEFSAFHSLNSDELWHHYRGDALKLYLFRDDRLEILSLGAGNVSGQEPMAVIPAGTIFGAELVKPSLDGYALLGCTVAPGFEFDDFKLETCSDLCSRFPDHRGLIKRLTRSG